MCKVLKCEFYEKGSNTYCEDCGLANERFGKAVGCGKKETDLDQEGDEDDFWRPKAYNN